jgi:hypothetical protein
MSERSKPQPLIMEDMRDYLVDEVVKKQTISDKELRILPRIVIGDMANPFDCRLREAEPDGLVSTVQEMGMLEEVFHYEGVRNERVAPGSSEERTKAQNDAAMFMYGATYALRCVVDARRSWIEREEKRERLAPYIVCLEQLIEGLDGFTANELWSRLYDRTMAMARASEDHAFIDYYDEDMYSRHLYFDLLQFLDPQYNRLLVSKLRIRKTTSVPDCAPITHQT